MPQSLSFLDNLSMNRKLLVVYWACVFVPIVVLIGLFYTWMEINLRERQEQAMVVAVSKASTRLIQDLEATLSISDKLILDRRFIEFLAPPLLSERVANFSNRLILDEIINTYTLANTFLEGIDLYVDNPRVFLGGRIRPLDELKWENTWYQDYLGQPNKIYLNSFKDGDKSVISLIRPMDFFEETSTDLVRINISRSSFDKILKEEFPEAARMSTYLVDNRDRVVASNKEISWSLHDDGFGRISGLSLPEEHLVSPVSSRKLTSFDGWRIISFALPSVIAEQLDNLRFWFLGLFAVSLFFTTGVILVISHSLTRRVSILVKGMAGASGDDLKPISGEVSSDEIGVAIHQFNIMVARINNLLSSVYESGLRQNHLELEKKNAELHALQSQINPHFLYNILNVINANCLVRGEEETAKVIRSLSKLFRRLTYWNDDLVTVEEELEFVKEYLSIQQYRFEDKLTYSIVSEEGAKSQLIPKMCLQPLVENACIHGIEKLDSNGLITILVQNSTGKLVLTVSDNGPGLVARPSEGRGIGLSNVEKRLSLYFGTDYKLSYGPSSVVQGLGTTVRIEVPLTPIQGGAHES